MIKITMQNLYLFSFHIEKISSVINWNQKKTPTIVSLREYFWNLAIKTISEY